MPSARTTLPSTRKSRRTAVVAAIRAGWWALAVLLAAAGLARGAEAPRVLLLFGNDRLLPANQRVDEGLRRALDPKGNQSAVTFFTEFLDVVRFPGPEHAQELEDYLAKRYRNLPPDALIALGGEALNFLLARRDRLFPGTPLVFGGVGMEVGRSLEGVPGVTGVLMETTVAPVVESLLAMRPQTRQIVLVHGSAASDRGWRETALRQCRPFADRVQITALPELPLEALKARVAALPAETAVIYLTYFQSPTGETYTPARVVREIAAAAAVPVMGCYDTYLGTGILGAACAPFEDVGVAIGTLARRVLAGERPERIGFLLPSPPRLIVDEGQVERWGIDSLPAGTEVRFHAPTLWEDPIPNAAAASAFHHLRGSCQVVGLRVLSRDEISPGSRRPVRHGDVRMPVPSHLFGLAGVVPAGRCP